MRVHRVMASASGDPQQADPFGVNSHAHVDPRWALRASGGRTDPHASQQRAVSALLSFRAPSSSTLRGRPAAPCRRAVAIDVRKGANGKVVELHQVPNEHSNGMLVVYLPVEKVLYTADVTVLNPNPVQLSVLKSVVGVVDRLKLDYNSWMPAHPPNPDRPLTKADVVAALAVGTK